MHLVRLALTDFRSYETAEVDLDPGVTTFTGPNGAGKTNLIEAACYVATFSSHRVSADAAMIRSGTDRAILRASIRGAAQGGAATGGAVRDSLVEIELNSGKANRVRLNRAPLARPRDALGTLRCVLFAPEDLAIVKGDPSERRGFLDDLLVASRPRYAAVRADYDRVVRQRNALLKSAKSAGRGEPAGLEVWDEQLVRHGAELILGRLKLVEVLRPLIEASYADVAAGQRGASVSYRQGSERSAVRDPEPDLDKLAGLLRESLERLRRAELERAVCLVGPHRDELELRIGDLPARGYASHGESWSLALALRLAAFGLLRADGDDPVLMLDDVFAELDAGRRDRLAELVADAEQVLVTAAVCADIPARLAQASAGYLVRDGVIERG
ncbi:MAG TPA: DNA replication/repair protein RecF [Streptosporangiaceae bacterium]|nr:DNA replication/repair protein RecF [Streptosporangiaceae bacterium]